MFKDGDGGRRHSKLKADARGTDTKLQQMDEGLNWLNKEGGHKIEDEVS